MKVPLPPPAGRTTRKLGLRKRKHPETTSLSSPPSHSSGSSAGEGADSFGTGAKAPEAAESDGRGKKLPPCRQRPSDGGSGREGVFPPGIFLPAPSFSGVSPAAVGRGIPSSPPFSSAFPSPHSGGERAEGGEGEARSAVPETAEGGGAIPPGGWQNQSVAPKGAFPVHPMNFPLGGHWRMDDRPPGWYPAGGAALWWVPQPRHCPDGDPPEGGWPPQRRNAPAFGGGHFLRWWFSLGNTTSTVGAHRWEGGGRSRVEEVSGSPPFREAPEGGAFSGKLNSPPLPDSLVGFGGRGGWGLHRAPLPEKSLSARGGTFGMDGPNKKSAFNEEEGMATV